MLRGSLKRGNICETTPKCVSGGDVTSGCGFAAQPGEAAPFSQLLPLFFLLQIAPLIFVLRPGARIPLPLQGAIRSIGLPMVFIKEWMVCFPSRTTLILTEF